MQHSGQSPKVLFLNIAPRRLPDDTLLIGGISTASVCFALRGERSVLPNVYSGVKLRLWWAIPLLGLATLGASPNDYLSAKQKFDSIESDRLRAGSRVELSIRELDAYAERESRKGCETRTSKWWLQAWRRAPPRWISESCAARTDTRLAG